MHTDAAPASNKLGQAEILAPLGVLSPDERRRRAIEASLTGPMGKKSQRHSWAEAKRLCRLNQHDIQMAKSLGFRPDGLIRSRPDPKQRWKLPVKDWIRELHSKRFGCVLRQNPKPAPQSAAPVFDEEAGRRFEEELYWEDYWDRNSDVGE